MSKIDKHILSQLRVQNRAYQERIRVYVEFLAENPIVNKEFNRWYKEKVGN